MAQTSADTRAPAPRKDDEELRPLDDPALIKLAAGWLAAPANQQWLDFGAGSRLVTPEYLRILTQKDSYVIRAFVPPEVGAPIGVVGLSDVNRHFRTATLWAVLGDKRHARRGYATRAVSNLLTLAFTELRLGAVTTWVVEHNPSIQIARRLNFRLIGRQRQCHYIAGVPYDRLWFDLLASEHLDGQPAGSHSS